MMDATWSDNDIIAKLHQDFSSLSTMNRAREELKSLYQEPGEPNTVFIYKYIQMHFLSTGIRSQRETHHLVLQGIGTSIGTSAQQGCSKEIYRHQEQAPYIGGKSFQLAEQCSRKMQGASSLGQSYSLNLQSSGKLDFQHRSEQGHTGTLKQLQQKAMGTSRIITK